VVGAMQTGAKGFITKPFSREKLFRAINQAPTIKKQIV
jgi:FixJ family two-component response regulator